MQNYLDHLARTISIGQFLNPQEEAQRTLEFFRTTGALRFREQDNDGDVFNMINFIDHVPYHFLSSAGDAPVRDAYKVATMTRINIMVQEIKENLATHCGLSGVSVIPGQYLELLDRLPEEFTKLFMEMVFGELAKTLPTVAEYRKRCPDGLPEGAYDGEHGLQVYILYDKHPDDRSIIQNFGIHVSAFRFYRKKGDSHFFHNVLASFHDDVP